MLQALFHAWERRLAAVTKDRVVRPFEWGLEWIPSNGHGPDAQAHAVLHEWVERVMRDTDAFFTPAPTRDYHLSADNDLLTFPSALVTPHVENNTVYARLFAPKRKAAPQRRAAVLVLPQWNSDPNGHAGLCRL